MTKFHVDSIQRWESFEHNGVTYDLGHLASHAVEFQGEKLALKFIVTYGLHCFTDDESQYGIALRYADGRHERKICLERYEASKQLRGILEKLDQGAAIYQTKEERFFTFEMLNSSTGKRESYKICLAFFHEHRLMRMHVTSAFFARRGEGVDFPVSKKGYTIFKIASETRMKPRGHPYPKEVRNRPQKKK